MQLHRWAGEDTWQMPRADLCRQLLQTNQRQLRRCCETLLAAAQHLEQQAELIESSVLAGVGRTP